MTAPILIDSTSSAIADFSWKDFQNNFNDTVNTCEEIYFNSYSGTNYRWNFGDGFSVSVNSDSISHTYNSPGNYSIQLITTNGCGSMDSVSKTIVVDGVCNNAIDSHPSPNGLISIIYPNPFRDNSNLVISDPGKLQSVKYYYLKVYDIQGRIVKQVRMDKLYYTIERENLNSGMYYYKLDGGNGYTTSGRFVIQ
jgi:PKD repeat protein